MSKSDYLETALLNHVLRATPYTGPATVYAALFTAAPGEASAGTEVSGGSYARQAVTFSAPSSGSVSNSSEVLFPTATADWGTIVAYAVMDASTGGNVLYYGTLSASRTVLTNDQIRFPVGQLTITED